MILIAELMEAAKRFDESVTKADYEFSEPDVLNAMGRAYKDLIRVIKWAKSAGHLPTCHYMAKMDMHMDYELIHPCDCGWSEIQSLLGE